MAGAGSCATNRVLPMPALPTTMMIPPTPARRIASTAAKGADSTTRPARGDVKPAMPRELAASALG